MRFVRKGHTGSLAKCTCSEIFSDEYWLTTGWRTLRRQILEVAWQEVNPILNDIGNSPHPADAVVRGFEHRLYESIGKRARQSAMWADALRLFPLPVDLCATIMTERSALLRNDGPAPAAIFKTALRRPLEEARRNLLPGSMQRRKNWETIDRISREIFDHTAPNDQRCSIEHAHDVAGELLRRFPGSRNLRLSASSIQGYFEDFLPACSPVLPHENPANLNAVEESFEDAELLRRLDIASANLDDCIARLDSLKLELLHVVYHIGAGEDVTWVSAQAFRQGRNLSRYAFDSLHREILLELGRCLSHRVEQDNDG